MEFIEKPIVKANRNNKIPERLQTRYEQHTGFSLQDVKVHYNSDKPRKLLASAFTLGNQIFLGSGKENDLKHELAHVIQQKAGIVKGEYNAHNLFFNDNKKLEHDSDMEQLPVYKSSASFTKPIVQRRKLEYGELLKYLGIRTKELSDYELIIAHMNINAGLNKNERDDRNFNPLSILDKYFADALDIVDASFRFKVLRQTYNTSGTVGRNPDSPNILEKFKLSGEEIANNHFMEGTEEKMLSVLKVVQQYTDDKGIKAIMEGALINVKQMGTYLYKNKISSDVFINRLTSMCKYIRDVGEKNMESRKIKDFYLIRSSGSDPHNNGSHALMLYPRPYIDLKPLVYKEHSLEFENMVFGKQKNSMIHLLNVFLKAHGQQELPLMDIDTANHLEELIDLQGGYDKPFSNIKEIKERFYQLGILDSISSILGITDLHCENIGYSDSGSIILDGECGGDFSSTYINSKEIGVSMKKEHGLVNPSAVYLEEGGQKKQVIRGQNDPFYLDGKKNANELIYQNQTTFLDELSERIKKVDSIRIVLTKTEDLQNDFNEYAQGKSFNIDLRYDQALKVLKSDKWFFFGCEIALDEASFKVIYINDFKNGVLPSANLIMNGPSAGVIMMSNKVIGSVKPKTKTDDLNTLYIKCVQQKIEESKPSQCYVM